MEPLISAILDDDLPRAKKLLAANPTLITNLIEKPHLHRNKIFHWIYAGDTPLHLAAAGYRAEMVKLLLDHRADPNAAHNHRRSGLLHYAADGYVCCPDSVPNPQVQTLHRLLEAGAEINAQDKNGASALHRAVRTRSAAAVKFLLENGADATLRNKPGSTPFHLAVQNTGRGGSGSASARAAQKQIIEHFLAHGLSPNLKDAKGKSVLDWAKSDWVRDLLQ